MNEFYAAERNEIASDWFVDLSTEICSTFEELELELPSSQQEDIKPGQFSYRKTTRKPEGDKETGGGLMAKMVAGKVFEKVGVNVSTVYGTLSPEMVKVLNKRKTIKKEQSSFWATGISVVTHLNNPRVPAVHFNTRMFATEQEVWFGGGMDLNPCLENTKETARFHKALKDICDKHDESYYPKFKEQADKYFYVPHRERARGVGGIFFDDLDSGHWEKDFAFVRDIGNTFLDVYPSIVSDLQEEEWTPEDKEKQLLHRGLYTEFNLIYDRGTKFGLVSKHDPEAVLMSLPPLAKWA